jgi:hypothetical protein
MQEAWRVTCLNIAKEYGGPEASRPDNFEFYKCRMVISCIFTVKFGFVLALNLCMNA